MLRLSHHASVLCLQFSEASRSLSRCCVVTPGALLRLAALAPRCQQRSQTRGGRAGARPAVLLSRRVTTLFKASGLDGAVALLSFAPAVTSVPLSKKYETNHICLSQLTHYYYYHHYNYYHYYY